MRFLAVLLFTLWTGPLAAQPAPAPGTVRLRLLAGNLTSGRFQSYDPGHGARILQGLKPDVALLQEFKSGANTEADIRSWVKAVFGEGFHYYREEGELPNGIVSRFPILASGEWDDPEQQNRDFAWARIDLPGPVDLWAVSVHLSASDQKKRMKSADSLVREIRRLVPPGAYLVIGGDFNIQVQTEPTLRKFSPVVETTPPYPADESGNPNTNRKRSKPYDWLLVNRTLHARLQPVELGGSPAGLIFDSRVYRDLTRVPPILAEDSDAENMQHMAVVRDFLLP
jgi:endonuclease/exonuclease/phosphatase family metal-dependent hydrolase